MDDRLINDAINAAGIAVLVLDGSDRIIGINAEADLLLDDGPTRSSANRFAPFCVCQKRRSPGTVLRKQHSIARPRASVGMKVPMRGILWRSEWFGGPIWTATPAQQS